MIYLDTTFVVDLLRRSRRKQQQAALSFLSSIPDEEIWISVFVACELSAGAELSRHPDREAKRVAAFIDSVHVAYPDSRFAGAYRRLLAGLERSGQRIATMDLLIATSAILAGAPLVTRNTKHFSRFTDLRLASY